MLFGLEFACLAMLCQMEQPNVAKGIETFVGLSGCKTELRGNGPEFGLALDRKQYAWADVRTIQGKPTLLILKNIDEKDHCGTVREIVAAPNPKDIFEFECMDNVDAKRVVIGVHRDGPFARRWKASKAWVVDFEKLKLTETTDAVTCLNYNYAGADDGSDVRTRAIDRAKAKGH